MRFFSLYCANFDTEFSLRLCEVKIFVKDLSELFISNRLKCNVKQRQYYDFMWGNSSDTSFIRFLNPFVHLFIYYYTWSALSEQNNKRCQSYSPTWLQTIGISMIQFVFRNRTEKSTYRFPTVGLNERQLHLVVDTVVHLLMHLIYGVDVPSIQIVRLCVQIIYSLLG